MSPVCEDYQAGTLVFCFHLHQILKYLEISWCKVTPLTRKNLKGPQPYNPVLITFIKWILIHTHLLNEYLLNLFQMIIKRVFICQEAASWHVWHGPTSALWPGAWTWHYSTADNCWLPRTTMEQRQHLCWYGILEECKVFWISRAVQNLLPS